MNPRKHPEAYAASHPLNINFFLLAVVMTFTTACQSGRIPQASSDHGLLLLDGIDPIPASSDILAVYAQTSGQHTNFRIDFLDISQDHLPALRLYFDTFPGQALQASENARDYWGWDSLVEIIPDQPIVMRGDYSTQSGAISVYFDAVLDTVQVSIPNEVLRPPGPFWLAVSSFDPAHPSISDATDAVRSDTRAPDPIPILIVLENAFPSSTPAQAIRSWDGAHSGPAGERFGLKYLLEAVESFEVPLVLTDLRHPDSMAGLHLLGADHWVGDLERSGLLTSPDFLPAAACDQVIELEWPAPVIEAIRSIPALYAYQDAEVISCPDSYQSIVTSSVPSPYNVMLETGDETRISFGGSQVVTADSAAPTGSTDLFTRSHDGGAPLALREALASSLETAKRSLLILHADFQTTFMGDDQDAAAILGWIAAHPWIDPIQLDSDHLLGLATKPIPQPGQSPEPPETTLAALNIVDLLPLIDADISSGLASFAWQLFIASNTEPGCGVMQVPMLSNAEVELDCETRVEAYRFGLDTLTAVQEWEAWQRDNSRVSATAASSIVMHPNFLVVLNEDASRLVAVFSRHESLGSVPVVWDPFQQEGEAEGQWHVEIDSAKDDGLRLTYRPPDREGSLVLPLYLGFLRTSPGEGCNPMAQESDLIVLGCQEGTTYRLELEGTSWELQSILDTPARWDIPEDPNQEVPPGHFIRIPYAELTLTYDAPFSFEVTMQTE